jgi:hypothetical protein
MARVIIADDDSEVSAGAKTINVKSTSCLGKPVDFLRRCRGNFDFKAQKQSLKKMGKHLTC